MAAKDFTTALTDKQLAKLVLPHELMRAHLFSRDVDKVRDMAMKAVKQLAELSPEEFATGVPQALMLLTVYDHMTDQRTSGMIADYLNF